MTRNQVLSTLRERMWRKRFAGGDTPGTTTLRGPSPLSLTNAVKGRLRKLVQFGKVSVNGSTITCNNGVLSVSGGEIITTGTAETVTVEGKNKFVPNITTKTENGITFTNNDGVITANGNLTSALDFVCGHVTLAAGTYILNGTTGGSSSTFGLQVTDYPVVNNFEIEYGGGVTFTLSEEAEVAIRIRIRTDVSNVVFKPMIRLSSDTDGTFVPHVPPQSYSDIPNLYAVDSLTDEHDLVSGKTIRRTEAVISDGTTPTGRYVGDNTAGNVIIKARETLYTGDMVSFTETEEKPINLLSVNFEPKQDLHGYDSPWPAGGGPNIYDGEYELGYYDIVDGSKGSSGSWARSKNPIPCQATTAYRFIFSSEVSSGALGYVLYYDSSDNYLSSYTQLNAFTYGTGQIISTPENCAYMKFYNNVKWFTQVQACIELSTVTGFHPYSNECPIEGWTGVDINRAGENLIDKSTAVNGKWLNVNTGAVENTTTQYWVSDWIPVKAGVTYTSTDTQSSRNWLYSADKTALNRVTSRTFTPTEDGFYRTTIAKTSATSIDTVMVVIGSTAPSEYAPYTGSTIPISWQDEAGTVYGGYLRINRDGSVDLVGTYKEVDLGTLSWFFNTTQLYFSVDISDMGGGYTYASDITDILMSIAKYKGAGVGWANMKNGEFGVNLQNIRLKLTDYTASADLVQAIGGQTMTYPLATPTTFTLPSIDALVSYDGINNVWHSANGGITVALADADVIEQNTPHAITVEDGTNTISWSAEVHGKEMEVEYRTAPTNSPVRALNILLNGNYTNDRGPDDISDKEALEIIGGKS